MWMELAAADRREGIVDALIDIVTDKAGTETFRTVELEVVKLRLRMAVRQETGPVTAIIQHFA